MAEPLVGFPCPECGAKTRALYTKTLSGGKAISRTRRCPAGHRFHTREHVRQTQPPGATPRPKITIRSFTKALRELTPRERGALAVVLDALRKAAPRGRRGKVQELPLGSPRGEEPGA